jgi:ectoine hydroxylase
MTDEQRTKFERDGFIVVPGVLSEDEVAHYEAAVDRVYEERAAAGKLAADRSLHKLNAVDSCNDLAPLLDHPKVFGLVWSMLGWNVHVYHSHLDVHPPLTEKKPFRFEWHQDGGRQNREIESDPRPRPCPRTCPVSPRCSGSWSASRTATATTRGVTTRARSRCTGC